MPGPGLEAHEPVGLGGRRVDDLPDVDAHAVGEHRQLVDQRDVDRAEDVLEQLRQLRRLGAGDAHDLVADEPVELRGALGAGLGQAADHLRRVAQREVGAARIDALGREGEVEVAPGRQARLLQQRQPAARAWCPDRWSTRAPRAARRAAPPRARARLRPAARGRARGCASAASARRSAPRRLAPAARSAWSHEAIRRDLLQRLRRRRPRCRSSPALDRLDLARVDVDRRRPRSPRWANATASGRPT